MTRPTGGFILWVSLPGRVNTQELHVRALEQGISIAPGLIFSNTEQFNTVSDSTAAYLGIRRPSGL